MSAAPSNSAFLLGIDTCGPNGSVALARLEDGSFQILDQTALEGRTYSATLIAAIRELLTRHTLQLSQVVCLVAVSGPGSFTGVRVCLSAAKGLAEGAGLPVIAVSRLEVLAHTCGCPNAALDAHRHEIFLRIEGRELLVGAADLALMPPPPRIAVCDRAAADLFSRAWPAAQLIHADPPDASGALRLALPRIQADDFEDIGLLDGHYLRRSDAEIFGPQPA